MILKERLNSISLSLLGGGGTRLLERELMDIENGNDDLSRYLEQETAEIAINSDEGLAAAENYSWGAALAHFYLRSLYGGKQGIGLDVAGYEEMRRGLEATGMNLIDELWAEMGWREPHLCREMEWVAKKRGFLDDYFVEGALLVLGAYFLQSDGGHGQIWQPDLVEN